MAEPHRRVRTRRGFFPTKTAPYKNSHLFYIAILANSIVKLN